MATFHAPPWWPPPFTTFLRLMMIGWLGWPAMGLILVLT